MNKDCFLKLSSEISIFKWCTFLTLSFNNVKKFLQTYPLSSGCIHHLAGQAEDLQVGSFLSCIHSPGIQDILTFRAPGMHMVHVLAYVWNTHVHKINKSWRVSSLLYHRNFRLKCGLQEYKRTLKTSGTLKWRHLLNSHALVLWLSLQQAKPARLSLCLGEVKEKVHLPRQPF